MYIIKIDRILGIEEARFCDRDRKRRFGVGGIAQTKLDIGQ